MLQGMHPALRAGLTSATIMAAGDVVCQKLQKRTLAGPVDWKRTGRFAVVGLCVHGPFFLYGFKWLDTVIKGERSIKTALTKTVLGQVRWGLQGTLATRFSQRLHACMLASLCMAPC
jgi:hypothetical protein